MSPAKDGSLNFIHPFARNLLVGAKWTSTGRNSEVSWPHRARFSADRWKRNGGFVGIQHFMFFFVEDEPD